MNSHLSQSSPFASSTPSHGPYFSSWEHPFVCAWRPSHILPLCLEFFFALYHSAHLSLKAVCLFREILSTVVFYGTLISSFTENTTISNYFIVYLFAFCLHHWTRKSVRVILFTTVNQRLVEHQTHDWCLVNLLND